MNKLQIPFKLEGNIENFSSFVILYDLQMKQLHSVYKMQFSSVAIWKYLFMIKKKVKINVNIIFSL